VAVALLAGLPTSALVLAAAAHPSPDSYLPRDFAAAATYLADQCAPGEVVLAPTDLSLLVAGRTPCHVVLGHRLLTPELARRVAAGRAFYAPGADPAQRRRFVLDERARFVCAPPGDRSWFEDDAPFEIALRLPLFEVWRRSDRRGRMAADGNAGLRRAVPQGAAPPH
jgi:hypothetical protein